ncbi:MAG: acetyl/propionyl/methylcrotonyl-CoA carboxylase subunit alpha [Marinospirillum sp.]|uniref:acetyl/propionyl/methylcrotonyl-CoA carboxylase subunit alpha n=1 Tax=Marinospirillum sp. TaxID=2183934 RepID=UPI0019F43B9F|nr:acetyl/propionyl/methylcrotonyl-CoA carboxylase subunit alpha [Marinospirillum sp.]MBE0507942.1 acetyl/propionyl/methylcrotonyl-CoA carboxylase subunit alpha [Marinospirillum sp.]
MFRKILIANRGEIACRVIRTAHRLGIRCVAVYSDADRHALHVKMADEAVYLGAAPARDSYLVIEKVIEAAKQTGAEAIHPGYGFLSENSRFVQACDAAGIVFIGPPVGAIEAMGSKSAAKFIMEKAGVPLVPGYHGVDQNPELLKAEAEKIGYPVLLKATAGGGGKGMRIVEKASEFDQALASAKREAINGFGDDTMLVEKYLVKPRHVEFQVFCDSQGNGVYLFERDCSVQRRHQKVIEEAPAPGMSDELRKQMGDAALKAAQAIGYVGAGTVEFLLDADGSFFFMEMNTRLQVEHPVTEMITGEDLVEWQLKVAAGQPLPKQQSELQIRGHAFEARIYAEDPDHDFLPATGTLSYLRTPEENRHVRVDTGVLEGDEVSIYYDPMIAKLIVWDTSREAALSRMAQALAQYRIAGVTTNTRFLKRLAEAAPFQQADLDTSFIERHQALLFDEKGGSYSPNLLALAALYALLKLNHERQQEASHSRDPWSPWHGFGGWRLNTNPTLNLRFALPEQENPVEVAVEACNATGSKNLWTVRVGEHKLLVEGHLTDDRLDAVVNGHHRSIHVADLHNQLTLFTADEQFSCQWLRPDLDSHEFEEATASLTAPMNGSVVTLLAEAGARVSKGDPLIVIEAMKMEHTLSAPADGIVAEFFYAAGDLVSQGAELLKFEAAEE